MPKSAKSATKVRQPGSEAQANPDIPRPGRERRPSDKIAAQRRFLIYSFFDPY
jgi:hypothetical protein